MTRNTKTNNKNSSEIFEGRAKCALALRETLSCLFGRQNITEAKFQEVWLQKISDAGEMTNNGWYCPPPRGTAVLSGTLKNTSRLRFRSLREPTNFPSDRVIDWSDGILFVYFSNVWLPEGMPSDFSSTVYLGTDCRFIEYIKRARETAREIADVSLSSSSSKDLYEAAQEILKARRFINTVHSITDITPLDFGHSLTKIEKSALNMSINVDGSQLDAQTCNLVSKARLFINEETDWRLNEVDAYTIEPQMVSLDHQDYLKITFHYFVTQRHGKSRSKKIGFLIRRLLSPSGAA